MNYGKDFDGLLPGTPKECVLGVFGILLGLMGSTICAVQRDRTTRRILQSFKKG